MVSLRAREFGSDEWDTVLFDGENEEEFLGILANVLCRREGLHVQFQTENEWEDFSE